MSAGSEPNRPIILVVDDERILADTLTLILRRNGYEVVTTYDAESAMEAALISPPAVILSDVVLPGMNGIDLCISLRQIFPNCKVILSSGNTMTTELLAAAKSSGNSFDIVPKPVHPSVLLDHVAKSLSGTTGQKTSTP
jgi:CheY-like chemotaxis protein